MKLPLFSKAVDWNVGVLLVCLAFGGTSLPSSTHAQNVQLRHCLDWMDSFSPSRDSSGAWNWLVSYFGTLSPRNSGPQTYSDVSQLTAIRHSLLQLQIEKQRLREVLQVHVTNSTSAITQYGQAVDALPAIIRRTDGILEDLREMSANGSFFAAEQVFADLVRGLDARKGAIVCSIEFPPGQTIPDQQYIMNVIMALDAEIALIDSAEAAVATYVRSLQP